MKQRFIFTGLALFASRFQATPAQANPVDNLQPGYSLETLLLRISSIALCLLLTSNSFGATILWDGYSGTSGSYFNVGATFPWENRGGDWTDANGTPQGAVPYRYVSASAIGLN